MTVLTIAPNPTQPYRRIRQRTGRRHAAKNTSRIPVPAPRGKAEQVVANALTRLHIVWQYEPQQFTFDEGKGFRPDFWLPEYRVFIEVTSTVRPAVIELKQSKIQRLREKYGYETILIDFNDGRLLKARKLNLLDLIQAAQAA